tara:strand:- start:24091 stop:25566 length:1476 start_codon:yes stop_codon:yes gene_type:complete
MSFRKITLITVLCALIFISSSSFAQKKELKYEIGTSGVVSSKSTLPFWLVSNRNGIIPDENSGLLSLKLKSEFTPSNSNFDYSYTASLIGSQGNTSEVFFDELYSSLKWQNIIFDIGIKHREINYDGISMSNGNLLFSGNSRSYPKISVGINNYVSVPLTNNWLAIKGEFSNGILLDNRYVDNANIHHKNAFLRIGKENGLSFTIGLDHYAQWGGKSPKWGNLGGLNAFKEAVLVQAGKVLIDPDGNESITESYNKSGNHLGQNSFKIAYSNDKLFSSLTLKNIYEDKSGDFRHLPDVKDWNISFYLNFKDQKFLSSFIYEYYTSKDQGGYLIRPDHPNEPTIGFDSYFNNGVFKSGWTNYNRTIGLPLFTTRLENGESRGVNNNAITAHHFGFKGNVSNFQYKALVTFSNNFGTLSLINDGKGKKPENYSKAYSFPKALSQQSYMLEIYLPKFKSIPFSVSTKFALDTGEYLPKNFGCQVYFLYDGIFSK